MGNPVGNIPAQVSWENFVYHVGSVHEKCSCGQTCLEHWWNFWNFELGKTFTWDSGEPLKIPSWEHLVKFGKISIWENFVKFGIVFVKRLLLSMIVEQNFGKSYLGKIFVSLTWEFLFGKSLFKILLGKTLFSSFQHGGLTDGQLRGRRVRKSPCLWHCS